MYNLIKRLLFLLPPECAHKITLNSLKYLHKIRLQKYIIKPCHKTPIEILGLHFKNPIGIAAGLDKNGDYIDCLAELGVGFIEVGAVTPKPQQGNKKPRLFRLEKDKALINRMGFNNKGVDYLLKNLQRKKSDCIIGVNLGKNANTPLSEAKNDYIICLKKIYQYCDFVTINISSPNTKDLRKLQGSAYLSDLISTVLNESNRLSCIHKKKVLVFVKISPDMRDTELVDVLETINKFNIDGIIANNTSTSRECINNSVLLDEQGGLSGSPIKEMSYDTLVIIEKYNFSKEKIIISSGGIDSSSEAIKRLNNGANLVQIYTGLVFNGPDLLYQCSEEYKLSKDIQ